MDQAKVDKFRERLLQEQERLEAEVKSGDDMRVEHLRPPGELSDVSTHAAERDAEGLQEQLAVSETLHNELRAVNDALRRTREGTYGQCQRCGGRIPLKRLEAIPYTPFCIECEREEESV